LAGEEKGGKREGRFAVRDLPGEGGEDKAHFHLSTIFEGKGDVFHHPCQCFVQGGRGVLASTVGGREGGRTKFTPVTMQEREEKGIGVESVTVSPGSDTMFRFS